MLSVSICLIVIILKEVKQDKYRSISILGRQPELSLAELESLYGGDRINPLQGAAAMDFDVNELNFKRLGGTVKLGKVLSIRPNTKWNDIYNYLVKTIPEHLKFVPDGSFTLGLSVYGLKVSEKQINRDLLAIKKVIKKSGRSVRVVPNKSLALSSAQVLHNKLTSKGAWELVLIKDGEKTILAQTMFVQDIDAYRERDRQRPRRDARVGMLPPKLAQIMINLAAPSEKARVLDPFCGTGVVLQEALLMGFSAMGSDLEPRLVDYSKENIRWLFNKYPTLTGQVVIEQGDATEEQWPRFTSVVSEVYLGKPLVKLPNQPELDKIISEANEITANFLKNLSTQLKKDQVVVLAVPAWKKRGGFIHLPIIDRLSVIGYNRKKLKLVRSEDLTYFRQDQTVARQILLLRKK